MGFIGKAHYEKENYTTRQIVDAKCAHIRNKVEYATLKCPSIIRQFQFGVVSKHKRKLIQSAYVFILLNKCKAFTNYNTFKSFFEFLKSTKIYPKKHCNDYAKWEKANYIHNQVLKADKNTMCIVTSVRTLRWLIFCGCFIH
jgi:hypothetical protein